MEYKITLKKTFKHLHTVNVHRFKVFCLCCRAGIPFRGLVHDLSKYSFEVYLLFIIIILFKHNIVIHIEIIKKLKEKYSLLTLIG